MNLVVIPFHDWKKCEREGFRTRDAHFMQEFDKHPLVDKMLVINRPISLSEMILLRRNRNPHEGTIIFQKNDVSITRVTAKTYTLDILIREIVRPIKMKRWWTPYIFGQNKVEEAVKMAMSYLDMDSSYALFISAPIYVPLVEKLSPSVFAFDALDNFLKHSFYRDMPNMEGYYQFCLDQAHFISANSQETTDWFRQYRNDTLHIPNGVNDEIFNENIEYTVPEDILSLSSPIVGYAGKMQEMFDIPMMIQAVEAMPDTNFVFIGQQLDPGWMKPLWGYPNVYYLGDKPYQYLPQYLSAFDVCIIPYAIERQHGGDPIKFYEYLAIGKPIVTTDIGNVSAFANYPQVRVVQSTDTFVNELQYFIEQIRNGIPIQRQPIPPNHLWRTKANHIIEQIIAMFP